MRAVLAFLFWMGWMTPLIAQFGNEWVDYSRQHWRFQTASDRLVRITYDDLAAAGFPVASTDPATLRVFARGLEQRIHFPGGEDGSFNPGDYFEVYVRKNNGWLDADLYVNPSDQANRNYSLFNDTASVFITTREGNGLRTLIHSPQNTPDELTPIAHIRASATQNYTSEYLFGQQDPNGIALPWYETGEGWFDTRFGKGATRAQTIAHPQLYQGADAAPVVFRAVSASASNPVGNWLNNHHLQVAWGNPLNIVVDTVYGGYRVNDFLFNVQPQQLSGTSTVITHRSIDDLGVPTDWHAISFISIEYPRTLNFTTGGTHELVLSNYPAGTEVRMDFTYGSGVPRLFTQGEGLPVECFVEPVTGGYRAIIPVPASGAPVRLLLLNGNAHQPAGSIAPVTTTGFFTHYAAEQLDSAFVVVTHPSLLNAATNYALYRQAGGMDVLVADVEQLYMQYGGGVWKHPAAIRRFCNHLLSTWESPPSHLFLVGKSIHEMAVGPTAGARNNAQQYARNLVPSIGFPTSDIVFTSGLDGTLTEMAIPTGRLSAENETAVLAYLNKVAEFENQPPATWMKRIMHFGGGSINFEQNLFRSYLDGYRAIAQDTCFGGEVYSFFKTTSDPIQINLSDSIQTLINGGVSLMTFFGHASSTGFDVNIDEPSSYSNQGKYPLLIGNSCYTGNIHLPSANSTSEVFTLEPNRGVIGFIAKSDLGAPQNLNIWTTNFYRNLFQNHYGHSIGQCMRYTVEDFQSATMPFLTRNTALTFGLHGDPALVLNAFELPDYAVRAEGIVVSPTEVSAELETFDVKVAVENIGKAINQTVTVELIRHLPNGTDTTLVQEIGPIYFRDTAYFELPVDRLNGVGLNTFDVFVDLPGNEVAELDDLTNNRVFGKELFITSGSLVPVFPYNFAIQPEGNLTLHASTGNPLAPVRTYLMQLDTVDTFDSNFMLQTTVTQGGGVVSWENPTSFTNDRVYYWRVAAQPAMGEEPEWRLHSFHYLSGERGWGQSHFYQFRNNAYNRLSWNEDDGRFDFSSGERSFRCTVHGNATGGFAANATRYQIDLDVQDYAGCGIAPAIHVAVIDPITLAPWLTNYNNQYPENDFGNFTNCTEARGRPEAYFIFRQDNAAEMAGCYQMLDEAVPDGHYLLVYSWRYANYDGWAENAPGLAPLLASFGSEQITTAQDSVPFIFFVRKGFPSTAMELFGANINAVLDLETTISGTFGIGTVATPAFGPATEWESLLWSFDSEVGDSTRVRVWGIPPSSGEAETQLNDLLESENGWLGLGAAADAQSYPMLRLQSELRDEDGATPAQLRFWQLRSDHVPECALNAARGFWFPEDTVGRGQPLPIAIAIDNIGERSMDSLLVRYSLTGPGLSNATVLDVRGDSLRVGEWRMDTVYIPTADLAGEYRLRVEANPRDATGQPDQPEQYHVNNILELRFVVDVDRLNPLLDVTFDGRHILNGDLVSARPNIVIRLDDENPFLLLNEPSDTASFKLFMTWPDGQQRPVYFANSMEVLFQPATGSDNRCSIEYRPLLDQDGSYRLLVQARDKSGNLSGAIDFRIDFEVYSKPTITEVLNYPNPFSTRTQFVFTVTGAEAPDEVLIRIMTVAGNVVREIRADEFGPITVGRNFSTFWWDGTDQFGDRLANGVYLYTVKVRLRGEELEYRSTSASPYFHNGIGKMYLLR